MSPFLSDRSSWLVVVVIFLVFLPFSNSYGNITYHYMITTLAGNGDIAFSGDNGPASDAMLNYPWAVTCDSAGNVYIADHGNNVIRKVNGSNNIISTIANNTQNVKSL
jgi:hypothetical protein